MLYCFYKIGKGVCDVEGAVWLMNPKNQCYSYYENFPFFRKSNDIHASYAIYFVEKGSFTYRIGNGVFENIKSGEAVICPPNVNFNKSVTETVTMHLVNVELEDRFKIPSGKLLYASDPRICETLERLKGLLLQKNIPIELYRAHLVTDLWYSLLATISSPFTEYVQSVSDPFFCEMSAYVESHPEISLAGLAEKFSCSRVTVNKCFRRFTGSTAGDYIQKERIWKACRLLSETNEPLKSLAPKCGFANEYYFSKVFRSVTGKTPIQYRKFGRKNTDN